MVYPKDQRPVCDGVEGCAVVVIDKVNCGGITHAVCVDKVAEVTRDDEMQRECVDETGESRRPLKVSATVASRDRPIESGGSPG